MICIYA
jgi:hypothetical protein